MKINLIAMGDIKEKYLKDAITEYSKRLSRFADLKIIELKEHIANSSSDADTINALKKDAVEIEKHIKGYPICLDIDGKMYSSVQFKEKIEKLANTTSEITFIIGASNGLYQDIKNKCKEKLSFSPMTFPHQLMRVIFLEQLYRAFTIMNNISYHK
ncbi:MAG: 23S rRNA (pseudouridine(1915)-N(3))-methyltransferase RlmH [Clostridia bacterium]|nr:23S rRNA (pseudouridine(1915)-N(3))-methyltransferase RlmH [Clostridia bacterium]